MSTPAATFTAHGHEWAPHKAGEPMPCDGMEKVVVLCRDLDPSCAEDAAISFEWDAIPYCVAAEIIGWRFATPPQVEEKADELSAEQITGWMERNDWPTGHHSSAKNAIDDARSLHNS